MSIIADHSSLTTHHSRLLFLHGWATDSSVWGHQIKAFSRDYEIMTVNLPGHGDGDSWSEPTLQPAIEKILPLITHHSSLVGIGWSLGAVVLMEIAHIYPDALQGLILVGATPKFIMDEAFPWGQARGRVRQMIKDLKKGFYETLESFYPLNFTEEELNSPSAMYFIELYRMRCRGLFHKSIITALEAISRVDLREVISEVKVPVLLIHGGRDQVSSLEGCKYLASGLPMARLKVFKDTGHAPFLTRTGEFNMVVRGFLTDLHRG